MKGKKYIPGDTVGPDEIVLKDIFKKNNRTYGIFICPYCNNLFEARIDNVQCGDKKSCGCNTIYKDLTGQRFGRWIVLEYDKNGRWKCKCDCGTIRSVQKSSLIKGLSKSCGCYKRERTSQVKKKDLTGKRFNSFIVLGDDGTRTKDGHIKWKCRCDCGRIHYVDTGNLTQGKVKSCGCVISQGEFIIQSILSSENILFETQKTFENCINPETGYRLRFDFYLPKHNMCIEFDGSQHFQEWSRNNESLSQVQYRDNLKNEYCKEHNIKLVRIPYWKLNSLNKEYLFSLIFTNGK